MLKLPFSGAKAYRLALTTVLITPSLILVSVANIIETNSNRVMQNRH